MTSAIVKKYARALAEVALEQNTSQQVGKDLAVFSEVYTSQEELRTVLNSPALPLEIKRNILFEILKKTTTNESVRNFLVILLDRNRLSQIEDLLGAYQDELDQKSGLVRVEVSSPRELGSNIQNKLKTVMSDVTGKQVRLSFEIDESLIGGVRIQVGSKVYDGTIKTRLEELGRKLAVPS